MFCYPGPRASYAVFVGPRHPFNDSSTPLMAPPGTFLSLQRGDLSGVVVALQTVVCLLEKGMVTYGPLRHVIIKTDSEYVVKGATERIQTWLRKGWIGCGESRVRDWDLWEAFLALLDIIKGIWNVDVHFWWVPAEWNRDAKSLAAEGLKIPPPRFSGIRREQRLDIRSSESLGSSY
ncbi:hypothetical protein Daus18300_008458 [Diaporthe australafricana]|uniref:ribonuclease H n=1 Tax=Diaporthe australafricana TaxID=127596 RepID=A0ABR3WI68_9PEZI